jgi:hypothetical protein
MLEIVGECRSLLEYVGECKQLLENVRSFPPTILPTFTIKDTQRLFQCIFRVESLRPTFTIKASDFYD